MSRGGSTWFRKMRVGGFRCHVGVGIGLLPLKIFLDGGLVLSPLDEGPFPGREACIGADLGEPLLLVELRADGSRQFVELVLQLQDAEDSVRLFSDEAAMDPLGVELLQSPEAHR